MELLLKQYTPGGLVRWPLEGAPLPPRHSFFVFVDQAINPSSDGVMIRDGHMVQVGH